MAQTYFASAIHKHTKEKVDLVARVLKDPVALAKRIETAYAKLKSLARHMDQDPVLRANHFPLIDPLVDDARDFTTRELDLELTKANQQQGETYYPERVEISKKLSIEFVSPKSLDSKVSSVLYSTRMPGVKFDEFSRLFPELAGVVAEATVKKWIEVAFFKGLFFHGDLHLGNMNVEVIQGRTTTVRVGLFDYGISGHLDESHSSIMARLELAAKNKRSAVLMAKYIWMLSDPDSQTMNLDTLTRKMREHKKEKRSPISAAGWLSWALSEGLKLEKNINVLVRGLGTMEILLSSGGSNKSIGDLYLDVAMENIAVSSDYVMKASDDQIGAGEGPIDEELKLRSELFKGRSGINSCPGFYKTSKVKN